MCRVLNVARAGFYAWLHNPVSARDKDNQRLLALIRDSYSLSGGVYGYRRVHGDLNEIGETCGKNRVGRIMQLNRIKAVRGYKAPRRIAGRPSSRIYALEHKSFCSASCPACQSCYIRISKKCLVFSFS